MNAAGYRYWQGRVSPGTCIAGGHRQCWLAALGVTLRRPSSPPAAVAEYSDLGLIGIIPLAKEDRDTGPKSHESFRWQLTMSRRPRRSLKDFVIIEVQLRCSSYPPDTMLVAAPRRLSGPRTRHRHGPSIATATERLRPEHKPGKPEAAP